MSRDPQAQDRTMRAARRQSQATRSAHVASRAHALVEEQRMLDGRDHADGSCAIKKVFYRAPSLLTEIHRELVHVQLDVLIHDVFAHLLSMLADKRETGGAMRKRIFDAPTHHTVHALPDRVGQHASYGNAAKRNRCARLALPELAKVNDLPQSLCRVG